MTATDLADVRVFSRCRNERLRLPAFLRHYRALGVSGFFIADNESTDGSAEFLAAQPDVSVFPTAEPFANTKGGATWLNALLAKFGVGHWCITVDIDELLVYPGSEHLRVQELTRYLDDQEYEALMCLLLDLYPSGALRDCLYRAGDDPLAAAPYFDPAPYPRSDVSWCPGVHISGGVRERVFYPEWRRGGLRGAIVRAWRRSRPPCLTKVPLVRWDEGSAYLYANHSILPKRLAPDTGVLLHFKFFQDFHQRAIDEAARGQYYRGASEYRRYAERLAADPGLSLMDDRSTRYEGTNQLVRLGLMAESEGWTQRVKRRA